MHILDTLKEVRKEKGIDQSVIYTELGVTQNTFSKMECGKTNISEKQLISFADKVGCKIAVFNEKGELISELNPTLTDEDIFRLNKDVNKIKSHLGID